MDLNEFHLLVGQTIMYCQIIEHDVKRIYAAMHKGDYYENLGKVEKWTLGKCVAKLKELDFSDGNSYISASDYNFLKQMTEKRNYWCHQAYQNFIYIKGYLQSREYDIECRKLYRDNQRLLNVYRALEKVRLQAQDDFNRISEL